MSRGSALSGWPRADVLGVPVAAVTVADFSRAVVDAASPDLSQINPLFITYLNAACSNIAADDPEYREILLGADCVYADGQAIVWAAKMLGGTLPERVNAGDFITNFCRAAGARGVRIALVGGRPGVAARAAKRWIQEAPGLQVVATIDGFFDGTGDSVAEEIAQAQADLVLVGMGVPLQEKWAWAKRQRLGAKVTWCVGALFEYYGEGRPRAPVWVRRAGFEWLFRLVLEPRRLWRRYVIGNTRFVARVVKAMAKKRSH